MERWPPHAPRSILTQRLLLRAFELDDVDAVHAAIASGADLLRPWLPWIAEEPLERGARARLLREFRGRMELAEDFLFGVFEQDGAFVGGAGLHPVPRSRRTLEIGYWIVPDRWGRGYATEAAAALLRVGIERMRAGRVEVRVATDNERSLRVPQSLGFVREGTARAASEDGAGRIKDLVVFSMLPAELSGSPAARSRVEIRP